MELAAHRKISTQPWLSQGNSKRKIGHPPFHRQKNKEKTNRMKKLSPLRKFCFRFRPIEVKHNFCCLP